MRLYSSFLRRWVLPLAMVVLGLFMVGKSLWQLGCTAFYLQRAEVIPATVTDVRQRPFESMTEALEYGNMPWGGEIAYRPSVRFTMPSGIVINKTMPDWDNDDYRTGEEIRIVTPPHDSNGAHVYKAKFLCGRSLATLVVGVFSFLFGWYVLRRRRRRRAPLRQRKAAAAPPVVLQQSELLPAAPRKKRSRRSAASADGNAPRAPRKPRKKKTDTADSAAAAAPKPRRRSRRSSAAAE